MDSCKHDGPVFHKFDSGNFPLLCKSCRKIIGWWNITEGGYHHHYYSSAYNIAYSKYVRALHFADSPYGYVLYTSTSDEERVIVEVFEEIKDLLEYVHDRGRPGVDLMVDWPDSFSGIYDEIEEEW